MSKNVKETKTVFLSLIHSYTHILIYSYVYLVITISTRLFFFLPSSVALLSKGLNSAYPAIEYLAGSIPFWIKKWSMLAALAVDSSQLDEYLELEMGTLSVCPSIATFPGTEDSSFESFSSTAKISGLS